MLGFMKWKGSAQECREVVGIGARPKDEESNGYAS